MEKNKKKLNQKTILTGDRPTGALHLGHYVGSLQNRVAFQDQYDCYFIIADYQFLTDRVKETREIKQNIKEIVLDYLAVGIDPNKAAIFIESQIAEIPQLALLLSMLVTLPRVKRNPTIKEQIRALGIKYPSLGYISWPVTQAADILSVRANLVPVGKDQLPHIELTRELASSFNRLFGKVFPLPQAIIGEAPTLPGVDGQKMSKSRNNAIYLKDSSQQVAKKVMSAYTDPSRIHATDPGHLRGNVVFAYLDCFHSDRNELKKLKLKYKKGRIGDVAVKKILIESLNQFLAPIREKRKQFAKKPQLIEKILEQGRVKTQKKAKETLALVKKAMAMSYNF